jgi:hypothetical protein
VSKTIESKDETESLGQDWRTIMCQNLSLKRAREDLKYRSTIAKATFCIIMDGGTYE